MNRIVVPIKRFPNSKSLNLPNYETKLSAGADLVAAIENKVVLKPGDRLAIPSGIAIALPEGYEAQIRPRSGLAIKHGITCLNTPGTIDADYRGEIYVILINHGQKPFGIERGMRIAQLVISSYSVAVWEEGLSLNQTERGEKGLGSTGE